MARQGLVQVSYSQFFKEDLALRYLDRNEGKLLGRAGAYTRKIAQNSIKGKFLTRKKRGVDRTDFRRAVSKPGDPPANQTGRYKKSILYGYDKRRRSVVIGPSVKFGGSKVPNLLEFGGAGKYRGKTAIYKARPHMGPALKEAAPRFPTLFTNSIRN